MTILAITATYLTVGLLLAVTSPDRAYLTRATTGNPGALYSLATYLILWPAHTLGTLLHHAGHTLRQR